MLLLKSHDRWDGYAELDAATGAVRWFTRDPKEIPTGAESGKASMLAERTCLLYRENERLFFRVDDEKFELTDDTDFELHREEMNNRLLIRRGGVVLFDWTYPSPSAAWDKVDPAFG